MDNFILIFKTGEVRHCTRYSGFVNSLIREGRIDKVIDITDPSNPKLIIENDHHLLARPKLINID